MPSVKLTKLQIPAIEKRKRLAEFSVKTDSLTDIMVNKVLSAYQRNEAKDVFDLYIYLNEKPKYNLVKLTKMVEKNSESELNRRFWSQKSTNWPINSIYYRPCS